MEKKNFFLSLLAADVEVSSKRFSGLLLIFTAMAGALISYTNPEFSEVAESMAKTLLYTGAGLLGVNVAESIVANVKRTPKPVEQPKKDEKPA